MIWFCLHRPSSSMRQQNFSSADDARQRRESCARWLGERSIDFGPFILSCAVAGQYPTEKMIGRKTLMDQNADWSDEAPMNRHAAAWQSLADPNSLAATKLGFLLIRHLSVML